MNSLRLTWPAAVFVAVLALLPTAILLTYSYRQALNRAQAATDEDARLGKWHIDEILAAADKRLRRYLRDSRGLTAEKRHALLKNLVYDETYFREAGEIDPRGRLVLTNYGEVKDPPLVPPEERTDAAAPGAQVLAKFRTVVMDEESVVLGLPTAGLGSVNLLVKPDDLLSPFRRAELGATGYVAFVMDADRLVLNGLGAVPVVNGKLSPELPPGRIRSTALSSDGRVRVVAEASEGWALRYWWSEVAYGVPATILTTLGLLVLSQRLARSGPGMDHELKLALRRDEFEVHYQPVVELATGRWVGAEALIRWNHPKQGRVRPDVFIPIAEQTGLITEITAWVIRRAGEELAGVLRQKPTFYLSVNLPPAMLTSGQAARVIDAAPLGTPLTPDRLVFELTERQLLDGPTDQVAGEMLALAERGIRFGLDDFGTGYSSLSYLHKFRFHILKIDKSFLPAPGRSDAGAAVLTTLIELGQKLGLTLIAEGVEQPEQVEELRKRDVKFAQGWVYCRALPAREFLDRIRVEGG